jgi:glycosyltransferase involved in cell wall biosynthesis
MEGLASGRPVLASRLVGIADIIESERCGVVFEPDPESLASAIERLRAHYGRYQTRCQAVAERYFSKQKFVGEYERIYADLVTRR